MNDLKFKDLNLRESILKAIDDLGYESPSPIQAQSIPLATEGYDLIGQAQTGTGKTAAFACSILNTFERTKGVGALILTPTRELAIQVYEELNKLTKYDKIKVLPVYGGDSITKQIKALSQQVDIVVGTPGRVLDLIRRKKLNLSKANYLVLDEADEMLNMGFIDDIESVINELPEERQTLLFSATMPPQIKKLANKYMKKDAKHIEIKKVAMTVSKIKQQYFEVSPKNKFEALCRVLDFDTPEIAIVFCKTKKGVDELVQDMQSKNYVVEGMHGDMSQAHRMKTLKRFKEGSLNFLVATDVAARGIDVEGVTHVINYDLTQDVESYVHRIGRTGRANREGTAYSFVTPRENRMMRDIKRVTKANLTEGTIPTVDQIVEKKLFNKFSNIEGILENKAYKKYLPLAEQIADNFNPVEAIAALLKMQFDNEMSFDYKENSLSTPKSEDVRLFFSIGKRDKLNAKTLVKFIVDRAKVNGSKINKIDILENFSFVSVEPDISTKVINKCSGIKLNGRRVNIEVATKRR
ncbi:DEAD/DEAH box helicase [Clostridium sp. Ade.TY]|uniref:DEAD/DEAH box helicase n=1 Tax=Clostridium sp. Ade.TY TaxID=1391647 RepID=UPI0004032BC7|nr:DEAD/DEAH box helicase [Clostridium sp. Ade.TY]